MTKTAAIEIARHLIGEIHVVAASPGSRTYGYNYACGPQLQSTFQGSSYKDAVRDRAEYRRDLIADLVADRAPDWGSLNFVW